MRYQEGTEGGSMMGEELEPLDLDEAMRRTLDLEADDDAIAEMEIGMDLEG